MYVNYVERIGTEASYANLQGSGPRLLCRRPGDEGTWSRGPSKSDVIQYKTAKREKRPLMTPGQTWVELLDVGVTLTVTR